MRIHHGRWLALAAVLTLGACTSTPSGTEGPAFPIEAFADLSEDPVSEKEATELQAILTDMAASNGAGMSATVMTADGDPRSWLAPAGDDSDISRV